jgi:hypothetical protein
LPDYICFLTLICHNACALVCFICQVFSDCYRGRLWVTRCTLLTVAVLGFFRRPRKLQCRASSLHPGRTCSRCRSRLLISSSILEIISLALFSCSSSLLTLLWFSRCCHALSAVVSQAPVCAVCDQLESPGNTLLARVRAVLHRVPAKVSLSLSLSPTLCLTLSLSLLFFFAFNAHAWLLQPQLELLVQAESGAPSAGH